MKSCWKVLVFSVLVVMFFSVVTFGKSNKIITLAVVPKILDSPLLVPAHEEAEKAAKKLGVKFIWTGTSQYDSAAQVQVIEGLIQKKVDGILISPNDPDGLKDVINKAIDNGIKVGTFDSDSPQSKRLFYAGTNNTALGKACGIAMKKLVAGKGRIKMATLHGVPGASNLEARIKAFKVGAAGADIQYLPSQPCNDDSNKAMEIIEQYTLAHPDLGAWFVVGGWPFFTKVESLPVLKKFAEKGGIVVTVDCAYPMLDYVKKGIVQVEIGQDFGAMGSLGIKELYKAVKGKKISSFVDTGMVYVDKNNINQIIAKTKPW